MDQEEFIREVWYMRNSMLRLAYSIMKTSHDAEDAVQDAIIAGWRKLDTLRDDSAFRTWMMRIVANTCRSELRRKRRIVLESEVEKLQEGRDEARDELWDAVCALEERLRIPVVLHYYEGFSLAEIARIVQRPTGTVATRLRRARELLRHELNKKEGQA